MKPFTRILVTIDLDLITAPVLDLARQMAAAFGAAVELVHVFETPGYHGPAVLDLGSEPHPALDQWRTAKVMMALLKNLAEGGITARGRMLEGVVEEEIAKLARKEGFDLIVIGSHSREGLDRFIRSSIAGALIRTAPCPVLVLPHVRDVVPESEI